MKLIKKIEIDIDPILFKSIKRNNNSFNINQRVIDIDLNKMVYSIGIIKTLSKRATSKKSKIDEFKSIFDYIKKRGGDLKVQCLPKDQEVKNKIAERFGIGISVVVANFLYKLKWTTLEKIPATNFKKSLDYRCNTFTNQSIVVEAKGTFNFKNTSRALSRAKNKKDDFHQAGIKIASCATLLNDKIAKCKFVDPPIIPEDDPEYLKRLALVGHYIQAFNLIGQSKLSHYFKLMRKRILYDKEFPEFNEKERLFQKIKREYFKITYKEKKFVGRVDITDKTKKHFIFSGLDIDLISAQGFIDFNDYNNEIEFEIGRNNNFVVYKDGICLGYINNLSSLSNNYKKLINQGIQDNTIKHAQDYTVIVDIDLMDEKSLGNYFQYLFRNLEIKIEKQGKEYGRMFDFIINVSGKRYYVEIKRFSSCKGLQNIGRYLNKDKLFDGKIIFITNTRISPTQKDHYEKHGFVIIDRELLKKIIKNHYYLLNLIK